MHLTVRPLFVLIELLLLVVVKDAANPAVGLHALGPHLGQTLFVRQAFVLHEFLRGIMQVLQDRLDFGLLIAGKIKFPIGRMKESRKAPRACIGQITRTSSTHRGRSR